MNSATGACGCPSRSFTPQSLFDNLSGIAERLGAGQRIFVFLDFDGTLAPIVDRPEDAEMPSETRARILDLLTQPRFRIAIISGRALSDLKQRVGIEGLIYAGNHGFEIEGPDIRFAEPRAVERVRSLENIVNSLEARLREIPGTLRENKGLTASVHYRKARPADFEEVRRIVQKSVASAGNLFRVAQGLQVLEIRPNVNWNKGTAARWILEASGNRDALPVYLGDDTTDEDAFSALPAGITIRVGRAAQTAAQFELEYQEDVSEFLQWLAEFDDGLTDRPHARSPK